VHAGSPGSGPALWATMRYSFPARRAASRARLVMPRPLRHCPMQVCAMNTDDAVHQGTVHQGTVLSVRGSVVDARFPGHLPAFHRELRAGEDRAMVIEVVGHLDPQTVRG